MERLAEKPFALLGVNSDRDRAKLQTTVKEEQITWRSWWDDGNVNGPIQTKWQVTQRPTIVLLDAQGIIRYRNPDENDLDAAIDSLLAQVEGHPE